MVSIRSNHLNLSLLANPFVDLFDLCKSFISLSVLVRSNQPSWTFRDPEIRSQNDSGYNDGKVRKINPVSRNSVEVDVIEEFSKRMNYEDVDSYLSLISSRHEFLHVDKADIVSASL